MSAEEFKTRMEEIRKEDETEDGHIEADNLMCNLLNELGYGDGIDVFTDMPKWYV
jgi:hypothetical protein